MASSKNAEKINLCWRKAKSIISLIDDTVKSVRRISTELMRPNSDDLDWLPHWNGKVRNFQTNFDLYGFYNQSSPRTLLISHCQREYSGFSGITYKTSQDFQSYACKKQFVEMERQEHCADYCRQRTWHWKSTLESQKTLGLMGMQERAMMMVGNLEIGICSWCQDNSYRSCTGTKIIWIFSIKKKDLRR